MSTKVLGGTVMLDNDIKVDLLTEAFTREDVEHIDDAICAGREQGGCTAMPGLEWLRNKVAARVGVPLRDEGRIAWEGQHA